MVIKAVKPIRFWQRLKETFRQRVAALPNCNPYALVLVVDRNLHALHFRDRREEILQKTDVIHRDHGKLGCSDGMKTLKILYGTPRK